MFEVDDYNNYVKVQTESALRNLATSYTYDAHDEAQMSLRGHTAAVAEQLKNEIQERLATRRRRGDGGAHQPPGLRAGDRRTRCCSASRPARSSPRGSGSSKARSAWWRWRSTMLSRRDIVTLDNERKAAMVSNLLVVLCGDRSTQPIVNTGTIYQ